MKAIAILDNDGNRLITKVSTRKDDLFLEDKVLLLCWKRYLLNEKIWCIHILEQTQVPIHWRIKFLCNHLLFQNGYMKHIMFEQLFHPNLILCSLKHLNTRAISILIHNELSLRTIHKFTFTCFIEIIRINIKTSFISDRV